MSVQSKDACYKCRKTFASAQSRDRHVSRNVCDKSATLSPSFGTSAPTGNFSMAPIDDNGFYHLKEYPNDHLPRMGFNFDSNPKISDHFYFYVANRDGIKIPLPRATITVKTWLDYYYNLHRMKAKEGHGNPIRCLVREVEKAGRGLDGFNIYQFWDQSGQLVMNDGQTDLFRRIFWQLSHSINLAIREATQPTQKRADETTLNLSADLWFNFNTFLQHPDSFPLFKEALLQSLDAPKVKTPTEEKHFQITKLQNQLNPLPAVLVTVEPIRPSFEDDTDGLKGYADYQRDTVAKYKQVNCEDPIEM